jgi:hypothetical protein
MRKRSNIEKRAIGYKLRTNLTSQEKESANTSISRGGRKSMPLRNIESHLGKNETILDYGAGRGIDYLHMKDDGRKVMACDPNSELGSCDKVKKADVVISNYVLNTLRPKLRNKVMEGIEDATKDRAYITVRRTGDKTTPSPDGYITKKGTFQKYSEPGELEKYTKKYFKHVTVNKEITNGDSSSVIASEPRE